MSTRASLLFPESEVVEAPVREREFPGTPPPSWDAGRFADEQLQRLVRQVFVPGWPKPAHHVAFAAVDHDSDIAGVCLRVGEILAAEAAGRIAVVEADLGEGEFETTFGVRANGFAPRDGQVSMRAASHQLSSRLWMVPPKTFCRHADDASAAGLEGRVLQLRQDFDYAVVHAPAMETSCTASVVGRLCDGVVLVIEAHHTRRAAAQKAKDMLLAANARLLGVVLGGRTFPIPERIYRRL
jgi:hypothetical protein